MNTISQQEALVFVMVTMAAADSKFSDRELVRIGNVVDTLPIFAGYSRDKLVETANKCTAILSEPSGIDRILQIVHDALPERLYDTAYAVGVEIASADLHAEQEELRFLQELETGTEIGAGWNRTGERAGAFVAVQINDPAFAQPLRANLLRSMSGDDEHHLLWSRPTNRDRK